MDLQHLRLPEWLPLDWLPLEGQAKAQAALVLLALALAAACLVLGRALSGFTAGTARWLRVAVGTRTVPEAPGGLPLLGHALSLATAYCPWEKMLEWARVKGPLTRFSILYRTGLIVNDPAGAKRVFQVRPVGCRRLRVGLMGGMGSCHGAARLHGLGRRARRMSMVHACCVGSPMPAAARASSASCSCRHDARLHCECIMSPPLCCVITHRWASGCTTRQLLPRCTIAIIRAMPRCHLLCAFYLP